MIGTPRTDFTDYLTVRRLYFRFGFSVFVFLNFFLFSCFQFLTPIYPIIGFFLVNQPRYHSFFLFFQFFVFINF